MTTRQSIPRQWLIIDARHQAELRQAIHKLPRGSGVLVLGDAMSPRERQSLLRRLRHIARARSLTIVDENEGDAARVHDLRELRRTLLSRVPLVLLSPLYATRSHPDWQPLPRMKAAALAQLARRRLVALGGMNERRFAQVRALGFQAWAGISAFRT
jgi:thiamine-phosphate pyrophosphorylase